MHNCQNLRLEYSADRPADPEMIPCPTLRFYSHIANSSGKSISIIIFYQRERILSRGIKNISGGCQRKFLLTGKIFRQQYLSLFDRGRGKIYVFADLNQITRFY